MTGEKSAQAAGGSPSIAARRRHALMGARARRLARPRKQAPAEISVRCLVCQSGDDQIAIPLARVAHISVYRRPVPVPSRNPALIGVLAVAGVFHHVFDLSLMAHAGASREASAADGSHLIILRTGAFASALRVERALRVADLVMLDSGDTSGLAPSHPAITGFARPLKTDPDSARIIGLVDVDQITSASERSSKGDLS